MSATAIQCPTCGGPAEDVPANPQSHVTCPWCGARYERRSAEDAVRTLRVEVQGWLAKVAGSAEKGASVDAGTRSFLFNDRILPGLRREVSRVVAEQLGDVHGSPMLLLRALRGLTGFRESDATLVSERSAILGLHRLQARLESDEVVAFATGPADRARLGALGLEIDRILLASHVACASLEGLRAGAPRAKTNLAHLASESREVKGEGVEAGSAELAAAVAARANAVMQALDASLEKPPRPAALHALAQRLDETARGMLLAPSGDLRIALASTGLHRDAVAIRVLAMAADAAVSAGISAADLVDALAPFANLLAQTQRAADASFIVFAWARAVVAAAGRGTIPVATDTGWVPQMVALQMRQGEHVVHQEVLWLPFVVMRISHARSEGVFFVSGKQYEGVAMLPACGGASVTLIERSDPAVAILLGAWNNPLPAPGPLVLPTVGPDAARRAARELLTSQKIANVSIGDEALVWAPVVLVRYAGPSGTRAGVFSPRGPVTVDPAWASGIAGAVRDAAARVRSM